MLWQNSILTLDSFRHWLERTNGHAVLGNTIAPMLALKVYFRNALAELARPHREYAKRNVEKQQRHLLSLKNPAFIAEVKLDGERMVVHVEQGKVTMHTRRGRWYSDLYSPVLAPPIRRALQRYNVNVVLDGEVIAWDNGRQEAIPFGNNRTVALARKRWLDSQGLLEERDSNLHQGQTDLNVMKAGGYDQDGVDNEAGSDCWLRYELFDVLYVGGPDAARVIAVATNRTGEEDTIETGSVIHLNGFQRKRLLYQIITPQEKEVMVVPSLVIRPNGVGVNADEYFSATDPLQAVNGQDASIVDSIEWAFEANESDREEYDSQMRGRLSDTEISLKRAEATDCFYADIVDKRGLEGIVMKDLNASYLLEGRKYWAKHKPDHEENSQLNDIDLIILGAYHGTGMGPSGILNAFLLGCVDDEDPDTYCAVCKVNGGGVARDELNKLLESTGYQRRTDSTPWDPGQWFREENHGSSVPDFISKRSFQNEERDSPVFKKKVYPDLWIRPDDSVVLTIKASEIVAADAFQAGITLRFPRIQRIRQKGSGDDKEARQVETLEGLHQAYREQMARREGAGEIEFQSGDVEGRANRRFQTAEEGLRKKTNKRNITQGPEWTMPKADRKESSALDGLALVALEGVYRLEGLDLEEASEQGWRETAQSIKGRDDMLRYISIHGGTPKISVSQDTDFVVGGRADDARVIMHHNGLEHAIKESRKSRSKTGLTTDVMVRIGGVLKWTYVIAIVHQWKEAMKSFKYEDDEEANNMFSTSSIKYTHPELLKPSRHYYLLASSSSFKRGEEVFGISTKDVCTLIDFKRGLEAVANHRRRDNEKRARLNQESPDAVPWQYRALNVVQPELRWSVATPFQKLWPFTKDSGSAGDAVVIYPDLFGQDFGEKRSQDAQSNGRLDQISNAASAIESVLPLARLLGAQVTTHLHEGVTHVLCQLDTDKDYVAFADFDGIEYCDGQEHARQLRARLWSMHGQDCRVHFVTPSWIRNQWQSED
jgi:DNA ligase-4